MDSVVVSFRIVFPAVGWLIPAWAFCVDVGGRVELVALVLGLLLVGGRFVWLLLLVFWVLVLGCWASVAGVALVSRFLLLLLLLLLSFWSCSGKNSLNVIGVSW